jgi:hypothetical protein
MKAASEFILSLLIIIILMSIVSLFWLYYYGYLRYVQSEGNTSKVGEALSSCMRIDSVKAASIYLKNCGEGFISNKTLSVYLDEQPFAFTMNPPNVLSGSVGTVLINTASLSLGDHLLRITTTSAQAERHVNVTMVAGIRSMSLLDLV